MTSFRAGKCCHLVCENEASAVHLCSSTHQFLIYSAFVLVYLGSVVLFQEVILSVITLIIFDHRFHINVNNSSLFAVSCLTYCFCCLQCLICVQHVWKLCCEFLILLSPLFVIGRLLIALHCLLLMLVSMPL